MQAGGHRLEQLRIRAINYSTRRYSAGMCYIPMVAGWTAMWTSTSLEHRHSGQIHRVGIKKNAVNWPPSRAATKIGQLVRPCDIIPLDYDSRVDRARQEEVTSRLPFSRGRACSASSMSLQPGGSMLSTGKWRRSFLPKEFSAVMVQFSGGRQANTLPEKFSWGISCSRRITWRNTKYSC